VGGILENEKDGRKVASALKYDKDSDFAPKVIAKGIGVIAEKIIEKGESAGVSIYKDDALAKQLHNLSLGDQIPGELYEAVAEVLIFISAIDRKSGGKR
jgi:flagellar biosynthesis protein